MRCLVVVASRVSAHSATSATEQRQRQLRGHSFQVWTTRTTVPYSKGYLNYFLPCA
jgi:hypothetical protein